MGIYKDSSCYDLASPDGKIEEIKIKDKCNAEATIIIENMPDYFAGYDIDHKLVEFNLKSTLGQLGLTSCTLEFELNKKNKLAKVKILISALGEIGRLMLKHLCKGAYIGRLFAADDRRLVRNVKYMTKMFNRTDSKGRPLLTLGAKDLQSEWILEKIDGRTVAFVALKPGCIKYDPDMPSFLPTISKALCENVSMRSLLHLHHVYEKDKLHTIKENELLLVKTTPLHVRTTFARVASDLLARGFHHTSANILQPDTHASGDVYELYGQSEIEITDIPLEFYTLEPHRAHMHFSGKYMLQDYLSDAKILKKAFSTAPKPAKDPAATFIFKGKQLLDLGTKDWATSELKYQYFPGISHGAARQMHAIKHHIEHQPIYPFLKQIDDGTINSEGVLLSRYFPSTAMKQVLLNSNILRCLKGIYFQYPSQSHDVYFAQEDRAMLNDLIKFAIPVFWLDPSSKKILQYVQKDERKNGMFVPVKDVTRYFKSTTFGVYGSNLLEGSFERELHSLLKGIIKMRETSSHHLLSEDTPLCLITGGGPGAMEVGNRVAQKLDILSCANILDFRAKDRSVVNEQGQNPHIEGKMTYRLEELIERQSEFHLDFPIFLTGGIGTDFEFALEEVRRKVGTIYPPTPVLLFGSPKYWENKISYTFKCNVKAGTIKGSEWVSNCFYCVQKAEQGLKVYKQFFDGTLPIGKEFPGQKNGFVVI